MLLYRCYFFGKEFRIVALRDFEADSGQEAIDSARTLALKHKALSFELWEASRYIHGEDC
jgi:hypothetical protein